MGICESKENTESYEINKEILNPMHLNPLTKDETNQLYSYESAICKIKYSSLKEEQINSGNGFFCEINNDAIPFKKALFTNYHILNEKDIDINKEIIFEIYNEERKVLISNNRKVFTNKELDFTCIEIFDTDNINKFFRIDENIFNNKNSLKNKEIFTLQYSNGKLYHAFGIILDIQNNIIKHSVSNALSGAPLINRYNINLIYGMNTEILDNKIKCKVGIPFDAIINNIKEKLTFNNKNMINQKITNEYRNTINLIYEKSEDEDSNNNIFGAKFIENNKENVQLKINDITSKLTEKYNLKEGINNIQITIINRLTNLEEMFYEVTSLKSIEELKYLNTNEINNFSNIFYGCTSLSDIKSLQFWNVSNGNNFSHMFYGCSSISDINSLQNWNVSNGTNFSHMFYGCSSLTNINALQNWNVSNGNNFSSMFLGCSSLSDINSLRNWKVSNGNNFSGMFWGCSSLSDINTLQNWNVSNGTNFEGMFFKCSSLSDIKSLQNWNISNGKKFRGMFFKCSSLLDIKALQKWNISLDNLLEAPKW